MINMLKKWRNVSRGQGRGEERRPPAGPFPAEDEGSIYEPKHQI
jgi:hypothetical protein